MASLADTLQVWQSALGTSGAVVAFVVSARRGRALVEDVGFGLIVGAVWASICIFGRALAEGLGGA